MNVPEITEVKEHLTKLKQQGVIAAWELPYENLLTRRSAAIFFIDPGASANAQLDTIWKGLGQFKNFSQRKNIEMKLSKLPYRITFSEEEKLKNEAVPA